MQVADTFTIKGRGLVLTMKNDVAVHHAGASLRRVSDGATWPIRGVERFCINLDKPMIGNGESIGLLMPDGCDLTIGDEVEIVPPTRTA